MHVTCTDCGLTHPVELMERRPGGAHTCGSCELDAEDGRRRLLQRRSLAIAAPTLGLFAVGTGAPALVLVTASQIPTSETTGLVVLALPVAGLALGAAITGVPGLATTVLGWSRGPDLPPVDRIMLPLGAIAGLVLCLVGLGLVAGLVVASGWVPL